MRRMATKETEPRCVDNNHVTRKQLASLYAVSLRTVDEWMARGWIPHLKLGKCCRFSLTEVDAALRSRFEVKAKEARKK
jgi:excisionase family DNA binding protein